VAAASRTDSLGASLSVTVTDPHESLMVTPPVAELRQALKASLGSATVSPTTCTGNPTLVLPLGISTLAFRPT
jgi:hypothetical protein